MSARRARMLVAGLAAVLVGVLLGAAALFGPVLRDDQVLDRVVREVALDWRDFGEEAALARLQFELDDQDVGFYVRDDDCELVEQGPEKVVRCRWHTEVSLPGTTTSVPVGFSSEARIDAEQQLR